MYLKFYNSCVKYVINLLPIDLIYQNGQKQTKKGQEIKERWVRQGQKKTKSNRLTFIGSEL